LVIVAAVSARLLTSNTEQLITLIGEAPTCSHTAPVSLQAALR
jgi:hypothetical protein